MTHMSFLGQLYANRLSGWRRCTIGELVAEGEADLQTGPFGTMLHASAYRESGIPVVAVQHIGDNRLQHDDLPRVDEVTAERLGRYRLFEGDILFCRKGAVERRALVRAAEHGWLQGSDCIRLRLAGNGSSPEYVSYLLGSRACRAWIMRHAQGATMPSLNQEIIRRIPLALPPLSAQERVVGLLRPLDDKIELNRRMNQTLEAMAQALFKSWFVDGAMAASVAPGRLSDIAEITMGQSPPGDTYNELGEGLPFYQGTRDFGVRFPSRRVFCTSPSRFAAQGDVLLSVRAPVGSLNLAGEVCAIGRGVAAVHLRRRPNGYLYYAMKATQENWGVFESVGTVFGSASRQDVHKFPIPVPPPELMDRFGQVVAPFDARVSLNERESATLAALRDTLLPKLLSGEVRVREAESLVGAAV